jgi:hypothetical protein
MKDDEDFNKYYSVSYDNWFDDIVEKYSLINKQIGDLQDYKIVSHKVLIGERVIDSKEQSANLEALMNEFVDNFKIELEAKIDEKLVELRQEGGNYDKRIGVGADIASLVAIAHEMFELGENEKLPDSFSDKLNNVLTELQNEYSVATDYTGDGVDPNVVVNSIDYESKYQYVTGSTAYDDANYDRTDYTVDNDLIVMVTYANNEGKKKTFIINYNIYSVEVTIDLGDGFKTYEIGKYDFEPINH